MSTCMLASLLISSDKYLLFRVDTVLPDIKYCVCTSKHIHRKEDGWEPYVERKDILVWRKEHRHKKGLYHYKGSRQNKEYLKLETMSLSLADPPPLRKRHFSLKV